MNMKPDKTMVSFAEKSEVVDKVRDKAECEGVSVSDVIRRAVRNELKIGAKTVVATLVAGIALLSPSMAEARACSTTWNAPKTDRTHCEHCESLARAGKILKGKHLKEWSRIWANHIHYCPVYRRLHNHK